MLFTTGTALTVQHYRNTSTSQCNAVEELEPIDQNLQYDFDFQVKIAVVLVSWNNHQLITYLCHFLFMSKMNLNHTANEPSTEIHSCQKS